MIPTLLLCLAWLNCAACAVSSEPSLTAHQQLLSDLWDTHCALEFDPTKKSVEKTMETMVQRVAGRPYVNHIPTMIGGAGQGPLSAFYRDHFIFKNPEMKTEPISRTIGHNQLVDEIIVTMVHNRPIDWMLPGVAPTGHTIEVPLVAIVRFDQEDGEWKLTHEHIYWDQASVLAQVGILDTDSLDVTGAEQARKVRRLDSEPSNLLLDRAAAKKRATEL